MLGVFGVRPQAFYIIKFPLFPVEYVNDDVDIIQQGPMRPVLAVIGPFIARFPYLFFYIIRYGMYLRMRLCFANDKIIGDGFLNIPQVQGDQFFAFLILYCFQYSLEQFAVLVKARAFFGSCFGISGCLIHCITYCFTQAQKELSLYGLSISLCRSSKLKKTLASNVNETLEAPILRFDSIDSTNNHAIRLIDADTAQPGLTLVTLEQTAGKGQRGNTWKDLPGESLLMSIVLYPSVPAEAQFSFNAAVAVSIAEVLADLGLDAAIKWPNDIIINAKKAGGLLIENAFRGSSWSHAVVGFGLNVLQEQMPGLPQAISLRMATGKDFVPEELMRSIRKQIIINTAAADLTLFIERYNKFLFRRGKQQAFTDGERSWTVTLLGMNSDGQLVVRHSDGSTEAYTHGLQAWVW